MTDYHIGKTRMAKGFKLTGCRLKRSTACTLVSCQPSGASTARRRRNNDVVTLLQVITKFIAPVELHIAAGLVAVKERAVVHLEVAATIAWTQVDSIAAELRAEELAIWAFHDNCSNWSDGLRKQQ
jgi:hypothetical protein